MRLANGQHPTKKRAGNNTGQFSSVGYSLQMRLIQRGIRLNSKPTYMRRTTQAVKEALGL